MKSYLNASEFARLLNVDRATVIRWIQKGIIKDAKRLKGTREWHIALTSYEKLRKEHQ